MHAQNGIEANQARLGLQKMSDKDVCKFELLHLPAELIWKILLYCDIQTICSCAKTCKTLLQFAESEYVWKHKWLQLLHQAELQFKLCDKPDILYKSLCERTWRISQACPFPKCIHCRRTACSDICMQNWERKAVVDLGSKTSWIVTPNYNLQRHPTIVAFPKLWQNGKLQLSPTCLFCGPLDRYKALEFTNNSRSYHNSTHNLCPSCQKANSGILSQSSDVYSFSKQVCNHMEVYSDIRTLYRHLEPCIMRPPVDLATGNVDTEGLEFFLHHILQHFKVLEEIQKPSVSFVMCEPLLCPKKFKADIMKIMFEKLRIPRLCFVNKAVAVSLLVGPRTCLVIDSGTSRTVVTPVINHEAQHKHVQHIPIGGLFIAHQLARAISWKGILDNVAVSSLDTSRVKSKCFLPYNLAVEEKKTHPKENIYVRKLGSPGNGISKLQKVELSEDLYLAPESMYAALQLPQMVLQAISGFAEKHQCQMLAHIVLTGGNTELHGFSTRLIRDLREQLPQFSDIISVHRNAGNKSWDAALGATRVTTSLFPEREHSKYRWITREQYILYGTDILEI